MYTGEAVEAIKDENLLAQQKHTVWPSDPIHASAILNEEAGELTQACIDFYFNHQPSDYDRMREEAIQVGAMALRFLENLERYHRR